MAPNVVLFGKLPAHGDFVSRGVGAAERDRLDVWLARALAEANDVLGGRFEERYDLAQPWRFAWSENDDVTAGAIAPSVDAVGRRYPILVGSRGLDPDAVEPAAAAAEAAIYDALAGCWTADALFETLAVAPRLSPIEWTCPSGWWTVDERGKVAARVDGARPQGLITAMLTMTAQEGGA